MLADMVSSEPPAPPENLDKMKKVRECGEVRIYEILSMNWGVMGMFKKVPALQSRHVHVDKCKPIGCCALTNNMLSHKLARTTRSILVSRDERLVAQEEGSLAWNWVCEKRQ